MKKVKPFLLALFYLGSALLLSGCDWALLNPKGLIAVDQKNILVTSTVLMLIVVIPVIIMSFVFAWRYRESNTKATYSPNWSHSTTLEILWWSVPCLIILALGTITWYSSHRLDPYKPLVSENERPLTIQVIALEWKWLFIYPEQNIATINFVQFPAGVPVNFLITAEGPMNSFHIPQLAGQIYAMAGMQTKLHIMADEPGEYAGLSANFSGDGFSDMKFTAKATSKEAFAEWVKEAKQSPNKLTAVAYNELIKPSQKHSAQYFSSVNQQIYPVVVMKTMMPMPLTDNETTIAHHKVGQKHD